MKSRLHDALSTTFRGAFRAALGRRAARVEGTIRVDGLRSKLTIHRDRRGVPSIVADDDEDAWFGLGFCHGQDRAGQLEILVRTVRGTLAEIAGKDGVPIDRLSRRLGFARVARAQLDAARADVRAQLEAYARGVTAGSTAGSRGRAHDLVLFGCEPTRFEATDAQGITAMLCFALAANWDMELLRLEMLRLDGEAAVRALDASYPAHLPTSLSPFEAAGHAVERLAEDLLALGEVFPIRGASNAWAVSGARTASGRPIVAADPHLEPVAPPHWYLAHLVTPKWRVRGATFIGVPGFAVGHNERVAWGVTAAHADNTDLFLEEVGPDHRSVRQGDRFVPCEVRRETIRVKGAPDVVEDVIVTPRGPLVGVAFDGAPIGLSISATWLSSRPYTGLYLGQLATSCTALRELFRDASTSSVNVVCADVDGHVGWWMGVEVPRRKRGNGTIPLPGWIDGVGWEEDSVPFESMPHVMDPPDGFVASANNAPTSFGSHPFYGVDFLDGYRVRAIIDAIGKRKDWDLRSTLALQKDVRSIPWEELREAVLAARGTASTARAVELLAGWEGTMAERSSAATVFAFFIAELAGRVMRAKAPRTAARALGDGFNPMLPHNTIIGRRIGHLVRLVKERPDGFFAQGWEREIADALDAAMRDVERRFGSDPAGWHWGVVRPLRLVHLFSRVNPLLDHVFGVGPIPCAGDSSTIVQGSVDLKDPAANPLGVPNLRVVMDLGDLRSSRFSLLGGQSGNPISSHYADQIRAFSDEGLTLAWTDEDVRTMSKHALALEPR